MNTQVKRGNDKLVLAFAAVVFVVVSAFGLGIVIGLAVKQEQGAAGIQVAADLPLDLNYLKRVYGYIESVYLGQQPDSTTFTESVARGLVDALGDKYSSYLSPEDATAYLQGSASEYEGIGVQLGYNGQFTIVSTPMEGSPGKAAGLKPQDEIIEVNGEDVTGKRPEVVATKIRGKAGTEVQIKAYRQSSGELLDFKITRAKIDLENITYEDLGEGIYKINIIKFTEGEEGSLSGAEVFNRNWKKIVDEISTKTPKGIIVDLRNNPGGYVDSVRYVAEEFLTEGQVVMKEQKKDETPVEYKDNRAGKFEQVKLIVLVNEGSASASEILAGGLQDNKRAQIIGKPTVGKGVEQNVIQLDDGALLMLVFKKWLTPAGRQISEQTPIKPDFEIEYEQASKPNVDLQLQKALELVK